MKYLSLFSGVEAATLAWEPLGFEPLAFAEIEEFPSEVLRQRWPQVPNLCDVTKINGRRYRDSIDVLVGGSPCQAFSIAGLRGGLSDPRGNLTLEYLRIVSEARPKWVVWENVNGVLSDRTNAFGQFVYGLSQCGYRHIEYRVLDAQYFAVPQRRNRIILVASLRDFRGASETVLFEQEGVCRDIEEGRSKRKEVAPTLTSGFGDRGLDQNMIMDGGYSFVGAPSHWDDYEAPHPTISQSSGHGTIGYSNQEVFSQRGSGLVECFAAVRADGGHCGGGSETLVGFQQNYLAFSCKDSGFDVGEVSPPLRAMGAKGSHQNGGGQVAVHYEQPFGFGVRRLTPLECERLQGMPDNHTRIEWKGKHPGKCPDTHRYKAIGNSMAVPVMRWVGERIHKFNGVV